MKLLFIIFIFCVFLTPVHGQQLKFSKTLQKDAYLLHYVWRNHQDQIEDISFSLPKNVLFNRFRNFRTYQADIAQAYTFKYVLHAMQNDPIPHTNVTLSKQSGELVLKISGNNEEAVRQAQIKAAQLQSAAMQEYLEQEYYQEFITYQGIKAIKPDHSRIALESVDDFQHLKTMILNEVNVKNVRYATNYVLSFAQSIPYATLAERATSSGAGFNPPGKLLWENQGDCDSKVTLTATLLRTLMPRTKMVFIFIEQHALIGVELKPKADELFITIDNVDYVLGEPTGPAMLALGKVSEVSEQAIANGLYSVELFHQEE